MHKRILFFFVLFSLLGIQSFAGPVDVNTAKEVAASFLNKPGNKQAKIKSTSSEVLQLAYTCTNDAPAANARIENFFYVFNRPDDQGFIIVSGDDRTSSILGYADSGYFDSSNLPDNFRYWLDYYRKAIENLPEELLTFGANDNFAETSVDPLLGKIAYNQDAPYNNLCPDLGKFKGRAVTGCSATSVAQVMRYYKYPVHGIGERTYNTRTLKLPVSADFANTTYDWDNMLETYKRGQYSEEEATAIATLMYHCGVAMEMDYNQSSAAGDLEMLSALVNYFNYDGATIKLRYRDFYTNDEWTSIIKNELDESRPVVYNGQSAGGGHSFVCDGYDTNGLFHINWGWGGQNNGYFLLNVLDPGTQGIGGGSGGYDFGQTIITGIQPLKGTQNTTTYDLKALAFEIDKERISGDSEATMTIAMMNFAAHDFNGNIGLCLVAEEDENDRKYIDLGEMSIVRGGAISAGGNIQSNYFPEGTYKMYIAYETGDFGEWELMATPTFLPQYIMVTTKGDTTVFSDEAPQADPEITDFKAVGELIAGKEGTFEFTIKNKGNEFNQALCVLILSGRQYYIAGIKSMFLADGDTETVTITNKIDLKAGNYEAYVALYSTILGILPITESPLDITLLEESAAISETTAGDISIYPNPVSTTLRIRSAEAVKNIDVVDLAGQTVITQPSAPSGETAIDVASLPAGSYILRMETDDKVICRKFIKR